MAIYPPLEPLIGLLELMVGHKTMIDCD